MEHQPYSIDAQDKQLRDYIASQPGWRLVARFHDDASGATTHRPDLQRALAAARAGVFDVLLVCRVDRFSRSLARHRAPPGRTRPSRRRVPLLHRTLRPSGPIGRMLLQLLAMFAQFERARYDTATCDAPRLNADAADAAVLDALAASTAITATSSPTPSTKPSASTTPHMATAGPNSTASPPSWPAPSRPPTATCSPSNAAPSMKTRRRTLVALKTTRQQLGTRRDELIAALDDEPTAPAPDPARPGRRPPRRDHQHRHTQPAQGPRRSTRRRVIITGPDRLVPVFRIPQPPDENGAATVLSDRSSIRSRAGQPDKSARGLLAELVAPEHLLDSRLVIPGLSPLPLQLLQRTPVSGVRP